MSGNQAAYQSGGDKQTAKKTRPRLVFPTRISEVKASLSVPNCRKLV